MRFLLLFLLPLFFAAVSLAQDALQILSPDRIDTGVPSLASAQKVLEGPSPLPTHTSYDPAQSPFFIEDHTPYSGGRKYNTAPSADPQAPKAEKTQPDDIVHHSFWVDTAMLYSDEGEYEEAERAYLRALKSDSTNPHIRSRLGVLYIQMKRYKEAAELFNALTVEFPGNPMVENNLAWIYAIGDEMKNGELALRHAREALLDAPMDPALWNTLAEVYYMSGSYDNALRASNHAVDLLKSRGAEQNEIAPFEAQQIKIQRSQSAYKRFMGLEDKEE